MAMKLKEIFDKVKSGDIGFDLKGHKTNFDQAKFIDDINNCFLSETDIDDYIEKLLNREIQDGDRVKSRPFSDGLFCFGCGYQIQFVLNSKENKLELREYFSVNEFVNYPHDYICPYNQLYPLRGSIHVSSPVIVANCFELPDCPEEEEYSREYSINSLFGRENVFKYKIQSNIAYAQMSNMGVGIYLHKNKDSIIFGPSYSPSDYGYDELQEGFEETFNGYLNVGRLSLTIWRYEVSDLDTIGKSFEEIKESNQDEAIKLDVKLGDWVYENRYELCRRSPREEFVYGRMDLMK